MSRKHIVLGNQTQFTGFDIKCVVFRYISTLYTFSGYRLCPYRVKEWIQSRLACLDDTVTVTFGLLAYLLEFTDLNRLVHTGKYRTFTDVWGYMISYVLLKSKV